MIFILIMIKTKFHRFQINLRHMSMWIVDYKYTGLFALFVWVIDSVGVSLVVTVTDIR